MLLHCSSAPGSTRVHESQRGCDLATGSLVVQGHQCFMDIPYADYFAVNSKLTVAPLPGAASAVHVSVEARDTARPRLRHTAAAAAAARATCAGALCQAAASTRALD